MFHVRAERLRCPSLVERAFDPLPIDAHVAISYGRIAAAVASIGRQPRARVFDLLIAATAHAHGARLLTLAMLPIWLDWRVWSRS